MDPGKFGGGSAPLRFDMAGGGGQLSFSMDAAPVMPGMDFSGGATDKVSFSMDAGAATAAAEAPAQAATTKARGLTGRVVLSLAGIAGDDGFSKAKSAAVGAAALDPASFAEPTVTEVSDAAALQAWWAAAKGDAPGAEDSVGGASCAAVASEATDGASSASSSSAAAGPGAAAVGVDAIVALVRGRIGGGGAMKQPSVTHAVSAEADSGVFDYDFLVIGGGSGGLACAKEASKLGARVCLCDFVTPSPAGTRWGLGGTCVNVGCIPKKLMHRAALLHEDAKELPFFGWEAAGGVAGPAGEPPSPDLSLRWSQLVSNVQDHIAGLNYGYKGELTDHTITYRNAKAALTGTPHEVRLTDKQGKVSTVTAARVVVAVGGRPRALACPGAELAISSDDIFQLKSAPGNTLIVGAGYIALETAGFLAGLGFQVTLMVRSILLRGFDRECVVMIEKDLVRRGVTILPQSTPVSVEEVPADADAASASSAAPPTPRRRVTWRGEDGTETTAEFDTVFAAIGRNPDTRALGLDAAGVETSRSGKVVCTDEQSSVPHVFAIGDVVEGRPELTPVAIQAGRLLARRLFGGSTIGFDYRCIATTVFTPLEYGVIGMAEEEAEEALGADNVDAYLSKYKPLEWTLNYYRDKEVSFAKVVVDLRDDRIVGLHYLGPNAGEVTQGFAAAMRMGLTLTALRDTVGIHPTTAEEFTMLEVSRSSGAPIEKGSC